MMNPRLIKGFLCHGLWILTPMPELLNGRRIICHEVVLADIVNAGAIYVPSPTNIVVDGDVVTGRSGHDVHAFIEAIAQQIILRDKGVPLLSYEQLLRQAEATKLNSSLR
jgi:protease I